MTAIRSRVYVRFRDGRGRTDVVKAPTEVEARIEADSHARGLRERPDVENAFRLDSDEPDGPERWR
jgi:hypothetical protein